jgi:Xaa-Pro aminopeptidase
MRWRLRLAPATVLAMASLVPIGVLPAQDSQQVPSREYGARRERVARRLPDGILLVPSRFELKAEDQHGFFQNPDFYYLSGLGNALRTILLVDGPRQRSLLFVAPLTGPFARWAIAPRSGGDDSLGFEEVMSWDSLPGYLERRLRDQPDLPIYLTDTARAEPPPGIPPTHDPVALWGMALRQRLPTVVIRSAREVLDGLRWIKSPAEVAVLRRVGALSADALRSALRTVSPAQRQRIVEAAVVASCLEGGGEGPSFWPWTMAGPNAVITETFASFGDYHHLDRSSQAGELIRLDVGCDLMHYRGDVGRTAPVSGQFSAGQREAWGLLLAAYQAGLSRIRDGASSADVITASLERVRALRSSMKTSLGRAAVTRLLAEGGTESWQLHGVGLESAESGARPDILRTGMVVAFEPEVTVDGQAFYLEDMVLVRADGSEVLTPDLPYTAVEIEGAMIGQLRRNKGR